MSEVSLGKGSGEALPQKQNKNKKGWELARGRILT
jgi:hypothetical protein